MICGCERNIQGSPIGLSNKNALPAQCRKGGGCSGTAGAPLNQTGGRQQYRYVVDRLTRSRRCVIIVAKSNFVVNTKIFQQKCDICHLCSRKYGVATGEGSVPASRKDSLGVCQVLFPRRFDLYSTGFELGDFSLGIEGVDGQQVRGSLGKVEWNEDNAC